MPGVGPRCKHWCFTLNNYSDNDVQRLSTDNREIDYIVFGKEIATTGTRHLQGTVCFKQRKRLEQARRIIGNAHLEPTRMLKEAIAYCKKDGDYVEKGNVPNTGSKGDKRNDMEDFKRSVKEGVTDMKTLRELHSSVCALYPRFVKDYVRDNQEKITVEAHPLRIWQQELNQILINAPDKREVIFIVDTVGDKGKSWFAHYYCDLHDNAQIIIPGKKADMTFVVEESKRVVFLDCPRSKQGEFIQYDFLEELKNGFIFSPKYESMNKRMKTPHVVVLMNEEPDMTKLSRDRYRIIRLD